MNNIPERRWHKKPLRFPCKFPFLWDSQEAHYTRHMNTFRLPDMQVNSIQTCKLLFPGIALFQRVVA